MSLRVAAVWAVALLLGSCQLEHPRATNVALVYGVTLYDQTMAPGVGPNLWFPASDARTVGEALGPGRGVFDTVVVRTDSQATKAQLAADLQTAAQALTPGSLFLFYFGGHSEQGQVGGVGIDGHAYLLPYGSYSTRTSPRITNDQAITEDELGDWLAALPTKQVVVVLDGCYTGGFGPQAGGTDAVPPDAQTYYRNLWAALKAGKTSVVDRAATDRQAALQSWDRSLARGSGISGPGSLVLAAAGPLELSWDDDEYGMGVFTYFFVEAQTKGDANGDGIVTVSEVYRYCFDRIQTRWNGLTGGAASGGLVSAATVFLPHLSASTVDYALFRP